MWSGWPWRARWAEPPVQHYRPPLDCSAVQHDTGMSATGIRPHPQDRTTVRAGGPCSPNLVEVAAASRSWQWYAYVDAYAHVGVPPSGRLTMRANQARALPNGAQVCFPRKVSRPWYCLLEGAPRISRMLLLLCCAIGRRGGLCSHPARSKSATKMAR